MNHANTKDEVIEAFRVFDKNGEGWISVDELRQVLNELGELMSDHEVEELLAEADFHNNGTIYYEQFVNMLFFMDR